jgi:hypothetical protein
MASASPPAFPLRAVAALFLERQHLREPRRRRLTERSLVQFASDAGGIQLDSINVIDRAHYLTVWSRFGPYDRRVFDRLVYERRVLFEYWAHAACLVPTAHFNPWRRAMLDYTLRSRAWGKWLRKNEALVAQVEAEIAARGPLGNTDFKEGRRRRAGGWWNWKPATHALDYLWMSGRTSVHSRVHFHKRFDLTEYLTASALMIVGGILGVLLMVACAGAEPDLELGHDRQHDGKQPINGHWVEPEAAQSRKERVHRPQVKGRLLGCHRPIG